MKTNYLYSTLPKILALNISIVLSAYAQDFDFFLFIQEWPGSSNCENNGCCFLTTGKPPSDFMIHGLLPFYNNGTFPAFCDHSRPYDQSSVSDLMGRMRMEWSNLKCPSNDGTTIWKHEWEKHGTCCQSIFHDEHTFFQSVLNLKNQVNLLQLLKHDGIEPNDKTYSIKSIEKAIQNGIGHIPHVECNFDASGKTTQLYWFSTCFDKHLQPIQCPPLPIFAPRGTKCDSDRIKFPAF